MQERLFRQDVEDTPSTKKAAQYIRMSREHQRYSVANQHQAIAEYAQKHGYEVTKTYADKGVSGLSIAGRGALSELLKDVLSGKPQFGAVLVYDVSRWGRFQDPDEAAHYEFLCREKGIDIKYCAEPFENDGTPLATIVKGVKRAMAGEYSRELSEKVIRGQRRIGLEGYWVGGAPGYGYRRCAVDASGIERGVMEAGVGKISHRFRTKLVLGPSHEVDDVRDVFDLCVRERLNCRRIADRLNSQGRFKDGRPWRADYVRRMLRSEKYCGTIVLNTVTRRMRGPLIYHKEEDWMRVPNAHAPIVSQETYESAKAVLKGNRKRYSQTEILSSLQKTLDENGHLTGKLIDSRVNGPSTNTVVHHFGSQRAAYQKLNFDCRKDQSWRELRETAESVRRDLVRSIERYAEAKNEKVYWISSSSFRIAPGLFVSLAVLQRRPFMRCKDRWEAHIRNKKTSQYLLLPRVHDQTETVYDFFLIPNALCPFDCMVVDPSNQKSMEPYRHEALCNALTEIFPTELTDSFDG